jgi:CRP/FNR family cyclic AMP-dependent transcriptional regulator
MKLPNIFEKEITPVMVKAGSVIYSEGDKPDAMYIVKSGRVDLRLRGWSIEIVEPDGSFGAEALLDRGERMVTAVAETDCVITPIDEKHFLFLVHETPFFALAVMRKMAERLRRIFSFAEPE